MEIERKFLLKKIPSELKITGQKEIEQYYLCREDKTVVRVRRTDDKYTLTIKQGGGIVRFERDIAISYTDFTEIASISKDRKIIKTRYLAPFNKLTVELDVFKENLEGLILAEIEFQTEEQAKNFVPPSWLGKEVTDDYRYTNSFLSKTQKIPK